MATDHNFIVKNGLEVGGVLIVNSSGQLEVTTVVNDLHLQDNVKAKFGLGSDLQIWHESSTSNSYITEGGSGNLYISGNNLRLTNYGITESYLQADANGAVTLYYDGSSKLATKSDGVDITGELQADSLDIDGNTDISGKVVLSNGTTAAQSTDYLYIGGNGLASSDAAIYLGNSGDGSGYGWRFFYEGSGSNNNNKLIIKSENLGSPVDALEFTQDGNATFGGEIYAKDSNSTTDPTYTFTGHTTTGMSVTNTGSQDELHFITGGTRRMHLNDAGVQSFANVYTGTSSAFRNYAGVWQGTTGVSGNGFEFTNTADSVTPLKITSDGKLYLTNQNNNYIKHDTNYLTNVTSHGYIQIGPGNTSHAHILTDRSNFYFNAELRVNTGVIGSYDEDLYLRRASSASGQLQLTQHKLSASGPAKSHQLVLGGMVAEVSLENSRHFYHPGLQTNVLAGLHLKGTVTSTKNGSTQSIGSQPFLAGSEHTSITVANSDVIVITLTGFTGLTYTSSAGIVFGNDSFRAKDVEIETSTDGGSTWNTRLDVTNQDASTVVTSFSSGGTQTNAIRYTLTNFNTTSLRILSLFAYRYNSHDQYFAQLYKDETIYSNWTFRDDKLAQFGNNNDLVVYHSSSSSSFLRNYTGDLFIQNDQDDGDIYFRGDDGSGGIATYFALDGGNGYTSIAKNFLFQDNVRADFGNSSDLRIIHNATNSFIENYTGDLKLIQYADDGDISFQSDDGAGGNIEYFRLDGGITKTVFEKDSKHQDGIKALFGTNDDLRIQHTGSAGYVANYTGTLSIQNNTDDGDVVIQSDNGSGSVATYFMADGSSGSANLYHYGTLKLNTKSDGVDITGELQSDSLDVDGNADISGNLVLGGNLTVSGTTTTVSTTNTAITDALIELGSGNTGTNSNDLGLILERGTSGNNVFIGFDESDDQIALALTTATGSSTGNLAFSSYLNLRAGDINVGQVTSTGLIDNNYTGTGIHTLQNATSNGTVLTLTTTGDSRVLTLQSDHIYSNGSFYLGSNSYATNYRGSSHNFDTGDLYIPNKIIHSGDTDTYLHFAAADDFRIVVGNSTRAAFNTSKIHFNQEGINQDFQVQGDTDTELLYVDASEDKVGIGTSAPTQALSVDGILHSDINENYYGAWLSGNSASSQDSSLGLGPWWNNAGYVKFIQSGTPHRLSIYTHLTGDHLTLQEAGGNVGIGVTDPDAKLEVNGTTKLGTSSYSAGVDTITDGALIIPQPARIVSQNTSNEYLRTIFAHETSNGHYVFGQQGTSLIGDMIFYPGSSGNIRFYGSGSEDIRFDTNGRIGVGTTSPGKPIDVVGDIRAKDSSDNQHQLRADKVISYGTDAILQAQSAGDDVRLNTEGNVTRLIATAEGNIGIGTTNPSHKLHVSGMSKLTAIVHKSGTLVITTASGDNYIGTIETSGNGDSSGATLTIYDGMHKTTRIVYLAIQNASGTNSLNYSVTGGGGEADIDIQLKYINRSGTADKTDFYLASSSGKSYTQVYSWEAEGLIEDTGHSSTGASSIDLDDQMGIMTLSNGNVGIGTPSTDQNGKLHVNGNFRVGPYYSANDRDGFLMIPHGTDTRLQSNNERFHIENNQGNIIITASGAVGIGTTSPDKALTISASDSQVRLYDADGTNQFASFQSDNGIAKITSRNNTSHGQIAFQRYNGTVVTESMRINSSGNVGIGTSSPSYMLDVGGGDFFVNGTNRDWGGTGGLGTHIGTGDFDVYTGVPGSGTHLFAITNAGQVGIGTESPGTMLHIKSAAPNIRLEDSDNTSYGEIIYNTAAGGLFIRSDENAATGSSGSNIIFETDGSEQMRIDSGGRVLINTTSSVHSAAKLQVVGDASSFARVALKDADGSSNIAYIDKEGAQLGFTSQNGTSHGTIALKSYDGTSTLSRLTIDQNGAITFNNAFTFPSSDGSANQVLITNGSGTVTWGDVSASNSDTVDNLHASSFIRSDANDDFSGTLNYTPDTGTILAVDGQAVIQRMTANGALTIGHDDALILAGGDTSGVLNTNIDNATETVFLGAEGGMVVYAFPNNDITWSNRKSLSFDGANGLNMNSVFTVDISGNLSATTKSFDIEHPTKEGMRLHHGVLEGPEHAVYIRGKSNSYIIELPDYWEGLVHEDTITVQLTPIGGQNDMWIENIEDNKVYINCEREMKQYFYFIQAERKDIKRFEVEYEV